MNTKQIEDLYPLSPMQQGMLFHTLYAPGSGVYVSQLSCILQGDLDRKAFARAWQQLIERHAILRTAFLWENLAEPLQVVYRQVEVPLELYDWSELPPSEQQRRLDNFLRQERMQGFDLLQAPLMRLTLIQLGRDVYQFVWSHHHILLDGWCFSLVLKEVFAYYEAFRRGQHVLPERSSAYRNYIAWLQRQDRTQAEAFWRANLRGFTAPTPLPVDQLLRDTSDAQASYAEERLRLSATNTTALQHLVRQQRLTLNTVVQGTWALLLSHYSGEEEVVFGATVSGRPAELEGVESMIGLFINTLPVRVQVPLRSELLSWLRNLQTNLVEGRQYEYAPLFEIQQWSDVPGGQPLFESVLVFENYPVDAALKEQASNLVVRDLLAFEQTNYPLTLTVAPGPELRLRVMYDCRRFEVATIKRLLGHYQQLLASMVAQPQQPLGTLAYLSTREQSQLLVDWNQTQVRYPATRCIHELIEAQVKSTPDAIALVFEEQHLSYRDLDHRANQLAHHLQVLGIGPEMRVGLCVERSLEMLVGLLGILKAGGAYVPLDPSYPSERLAFMLENSHASVLVTQSSLLDSLPAHKAQVVCLSTDVMEQPIDKQSTLHPGSSVISQQLAYVIYTSGSTGQPKGTAIPHRAVVNFFNSMCQRPGLTSQDTILAVTSLSFDIAALELLLPLMVGACTHIVSRDMALDGAKLAAQLTISGATVMQATPAMWRMLLNAGWTGNAHLKMLCGGEALPQELVYHLRSKGKSLWNMYGPTETTIWSAIYEVCRVEDRVPIGRAINNTQLYVLDGYLKPVPIGVAGELYIGGEGLARGYLHLPELSAERFIPNPFSGEVGTRMYRSGDLARWQANGDIEWLGRVDHQVKIRGFRIELEEIEAVLGQHPQVREVVVTAREDVPGNKQLVAYLRADQEPALTISELRRFLKQKLPDYMLPSAFIFLKSLPLTPNGKVDRRALMKEKQSQLALEEVDCASHTSPVAPGTPIEEMLVEIWTQVLNSKRVGIYDNFFESGGHSLLAMQLISRIRETFYVDLPLRLLFEKPTIADLATSIVQKLTEQVDSEMLTALEQRAGNETQSMLMHEKHVEEKGETND